MPDLGPFWLSLRVASLATVLIVAVGLPAALALARVQFPGKALVAGILVLPLVLPPTVLGFYLLQVLGRRSDFGALARAIAGRDAGVSLVGCGDRLGRGGLSPVLAAGTGRLRGDRPGARRRRPAAGPERALGLRRGDAPPGGGAGWPRAPSSVSRRRSEISVRP